MADLIITVARAEDLEPTEREIERRGLRIVAVLVTQQIILASGDQEALKGVAGIEVREQGEFHAWEPRGTDRYGLHKPYQVGRKR